MQVKTCGVCQGKAFSQLWDLPKFPFTEKFGTYRTDAHPPVDQQLLICDTCSHVQLGFQVSPEVLYQPSEYAFRTSESASSKRGNDFFFNFFEDIASGKSFTSLLDIGGNDFYLVSKLNVASKSVIDPVCELTDDHVNVIPSMVEEVDLSKDIDQPDLIFCRHVLEHIRSPRELLRQLFSQCKENTLYIFEIPCLDCLLEAGRFDAIFHQHYHYFDLDSFKQLIQRNGGRYVAHRYNHRGPCGGSLLIAFEKGTEARGTPSRDKKSRIQDGIAAFIQEMHFLSNALKDFQGPIYGYGASLMLATYAYHLKTDFSNLVAILDDDQQKDGIGYQNLPVKVRASTSVQVEEDASFLITSLENTRPILKRLIDQRPRRIFVPSIV